MSSYPNQDDDSCIAVFDAVEENQVPCWLNKQLQVVAFLKSFQE